MELTVGDKAPEFSLYSSDKEKVNLKDFRGKPVLILFYPLAFTSTCTKEICLMRDSLGDYKDLDTVILAISVDSHATLKKFKELNKLNFTLLSDFNKEVSRAYVSLHEEFWPGMRGVSKRSAFIVDAQGTIRYAEVLENPGNLPNFDQIQSVLSALK